MHDNFYAFQVHAESEGLDHHFRKPANDITSQLEINFGDLGRPGRGRGGGRGGRGRGGRPSRGGRTDKVIQSAVCSDVETDLWKLEVNKRCFITCPIIVF